MIEKMFDDIMISKYAGYTLYAHNFNKFDSAFIFRILNKKYKISNIIPRNTGLLCFTVTHKISNKVIRIKITDSITLLPSSLAVLGSSFNVDVTKDVFPHDFINENNLDYIGDFPELKYFNSDGSGNISVDMVIKYGEMARYYSGLEYPSWNLRIELEKYLTKDVISLYQILEQMDNIIYKNYRINITTKPTIASLALSILRSNFMDKELQLPKTRGRVEIAIRSAYFGGRNEVFIPIAYGYHAYDYNSLYPSAMLKDLPVGSPTFSLSKDINKIFGFVKVEVTAPDNIEIPVLPVKILTKGRLEEKLVFPCGNWVGWYFSEEVKLAIKHGYKIEILESYIFDRGVNVFKNYVDHMGCIKDGSTGGMRNIHKLLMNTPYGRLGMKNIRDNVKVVNNNEYNEIIKRFDIFNTIHLDEDKIFVKYSKLPSKLACDQNNLKYNEEIMKVMDSDLVDNSTPIAAAITSWARIMMYPYLQNSAYTDTDSTYLINPMDKSMVGKGLGKFKREYGGIIYKAMFISPKLYYLSTVLGEISKTKGVTQDLDRSDYEKLYNNQSIDIIESRWIYTLSEDTVYVRSQPYLIDGKYDKRRVLFSMGKWVKTSPIIINKDFKEITLDLVIRKEKPLVLYK